jgi:hypothetical protein
MDVRLWKDQYRPVLRKVWQSTLVVRFGKRIPLCERRSSDAAEGQQPRCWYCDNAAKE